MRVDVRRLVLLTALAALVVPVAGCNTIRYGQGLVTHDVRLNEGATSLRFAGVVHELEIYDTNFRPCTLGLAAMATTADRMAAEQRAARDGGDQWYTEFAWGSIPQLQCGIHLRQYGPGAFERVRHGGLGNLEQANADTQLRLSEAALILRYDGIGTHGLGFGIDVSPTFGGLVVGERGELLDGRMARWPLGGALHYAPGFLFGFGLSASAAWELLSMGPEFGGRVAFRRTFFDVVQLDAGAGWRSERAYVWVDETKGLLRRSGPYANAQLSFNF